MYLLFIISIIALIACDDKSDDSSKAYIPTGIDNCWVYSDTSRVGDKLTIDEDTIRVTGNEWIAGRMWWYLSGSSFAMGTLCGNYCIDIDTIFVIDTGENGKYMRVEFIPADDTPKKYSFVRQGDIGVHRTVQILPGRISTPAGIFTNCVIYSSDLDTIVIKPGVGIIYRHYVDNNRNISQKAVLVDCAIVGDN